MKKCSEFALSPGGQSFASPIPPTVHSTDWQGNDFLYLTLFIWGDWFCHCSDETPAACLWPDHWVYSISHCVPLEALLSARWCRPGSDGGRQLLAAHERLCRRSEPWLPCRRSHHVPPALLQRELSEVGSGLQCCTARYKTTAERFFRTAQCLQEAVVDLCFDLDSAQFLS